MPRANKNPHAVRDLIALEELFLDELLHKVDAIFALYNLPITTQKEIKSFVDQLETLTREDLALLNRYAKT